MKTNKIINIVTASIFLLATVTTLAPTNLSNSELEKQDKPVIASKVKTESATFGQVTHHTYKGEQFVLVSAEADKDFYQIYTLEEAENFKDESYVTIAFLSNGKTEINLQHLSYETKTFKYTQEQAEKNFNFFVASQTFNDTSIDIKL
ncbi:hypothetical protein [Vagococcus salmoninarum]|uniref:hypothetical protein n=1 Tax=Vagococcus salmoninarum TaxID=2739 RepID=UPI0028D8AE8B|nr:hypothetical protein [Vagococcus salmoninarum]